jgi:hypothetical protein
VTARAKVNCKAIEAIGTARNAGHVDGNILVRTLTKTRVVGCKERVIGEA